MSTPFSKRRFSLQKQLADARIDALLITNPANWFYLTGFTGESGALLVSPNGSSLITDGRFTVQARLEAPGVKIVQQKGALFVFTAEFIREKKIKRIGFDPGQITVEQLGALRKATKGRGEWRAVAGLVESLRMRKEPAEVSQMRKAAILASDIVREAAALLKPGVREAEVAAEIEFQMRKRGASGAAFETIVAFGERGAFPHARPTSKRLRKNELVVLDLGVILGHYCSDITRTYFVGRVPARIRRWYNAVLEAQAAAIAAVTSGVTCGEVDAAARKVLAGYRLDKFFVHSTGHGLGLVVHEDPRLARGMDKRLEPGNVVTIEPGIYVEGVGGIRIEDDVAVHADRTEVLTRAPRDLIEL
jgi:Xaa-Pro aminopeptidase